MKHYLVLILAALAAAHPIVASATMYRLVSCERTSTGQYIGDYADTQGNVIRRAFYYQCPPAIHA